MLTEVSYANAINSLIALCAFESALCISLFCASVALRDCFARFNTALLADTFAEFRIITSFTLSKRPTIFETVVLPSLISFEIKS